MGGYVEADDAAGGGVALDAVPVAAVAAVEGWVPRGEGVGVGEAVFECCQRGSVAGMTEPCCSRGVRVEEDESDGEE